jgi:hypothetical protein
MKNLLFTALFAIISVSLLSQTDILPPLLDKPADAAINQMPNAELDWFASSGIGQVSYEVQIDTSDLFENPVIYNTLFSSQKAENLFFGDEYFWRVKASDNSGTSDWSETRNFTVFDQVALKDPENGLENQMPDVQLIWSNRKGANFISGITFYDLEVSLVEDFSTVFYAASVADGTFPADTNFIFKNTSNLLFDTTFYWRVRARHSLDVTLWSEERSFSTIEGLSLTSPADGAVGQNPDVELIWEAISGVNKFVYQVCTDPNFTFPCITNFTESNSVIVPSLLFGTTYHWRVKASHLNDTTDWSEERDFQVANTVVLNTPENGAAGLSILPTLIWNYLRGADQYEVRWNSQDNSIMDTAFVDTSFFLMFKPLELGIDYFWKVRAINNIDTTNWSETWQFHTGQSGIDNQVLGKEIVSIFPNPASGELTIELNSIQQTNVQIAIINLMGKIVSESNFSFDQGLDSKKINLYELNNGLYFIKFKSGDAIYTEKLIIDK